MTAPDTVASVTSAPDTSDRPDTSAPDTSDRPDVATVSAKALEQKGRRWLIWSFVFCPCHLPLTMAVLAALFGTSAFGTLVARNALGTGLVLGAIYLVGVGIGFRYLRKATKGIDCSGEVCTLPER